MRRTRCASSSAIPENDAPNVSAKLTEKARASGIGDALATAVDAFTGDVTIWRQASSQQSQPTPADAALKKQLRQAEPRVKENASVTIRVAENAAPVKGGQRAIRNTSFWYFWHQTVAECTTAFGMAYQDQAGLHTGYLTAGHWPKNSGWSVNGNGVRTYWDRAVGGYVDRVIFEANGASWLVWNGIFNEDMESYPTHIIRVPSTACCLVVSMASSVAQSLRSTLVSIQAAVTLCGPPGGLRTRSAFQATAGGRSGSLGPGRRPSRPARSRHTMTRPIGATSWLLTTRCGISVSH